MIDIIWVKKEKRILDYRIRTTVDSYGKKWGFVYFDGRKYLWYVQFLI
jgi:hypothetical protein